ncbi:sensor histidine kinase [Bacillus timonensis]|uniref:sensor histidine kinase n=1 Tax=Bacillus timonensis TaxID=1033734 RepID=UPI000288C72E|nr:GHKL domain-containing protein [Bacillus timonensis]
MDEENICGSFSPDFLTPLKGGVIMYWGITIVVGILSLYLLISRISTSKKLKSLLEEAKQFDEQRAQFNETFRIVRSERHDFLKHVSAIHFMLENGKNEEAKRYLDELVEGYKETNLSIKGERGVVVGILHQMYRKARALNIDIVYDFDLPLSTLPLSDQQIIALIGNLLSNGIDACEEWQKKYTQQSFLTLQFFKRSGLFILQCKNSSLPIPADVLDHLFVNFGKTTKGEGHEGLGTKLIQDIIDESNGFLDFVYKEEEFTVKMKIPAIKG